MCGVAKKKVNSKSNGCNKMNTKQQIKSFNHQTCSEKIGDKNRVWDSQAKTVWSGAHVTWENKLSADSGWANFFEN